MSNSVFSPWPSFTQEEADAVQRVLLSNKVNYWTGEECRSFEKEFAAYTDCDHAIALANGTVALDLALKVLDIGPGDEVIVTSRTFVASASCIVNSGARPIFADVDRNSQNITSDSIMRVLTPRTKAIICVHLAGWPCDMHSIMELAEYRDIAVIEDCAQAHGATISGQSVGSFGHIGCWSFCQDKIMSTGGEGGMVTTRDTKLWSAMWSFKDHGKSWDAVYAKHHAPGFRWVHESFGTNMRMTEMQAVIGRIQLQRLDDWRKSRQAIAEQIYLAAAQAGVYRVPSLPYSIEHAWYKCYLFVDETQLKPGWDRDRILAAIMERGVPCFSGSCSEVYLEKCFQKAALGPVDRLPVAKELGETSLMFMVHPTLTSENVSKTLKVIKEVAEISKSSI